MALLMMVDEVCPTRLNNKPEVMVVWAVRAVAQSVESIAPPPSEPPDNATGVEYVGVLTPVTVSWVPDAIVATLALLTYEE
jgi:hypothetical protein